MGKTRKPKGRAEGAGGGGAREKPPAAPRGRRARAEAAGQEGAIALAADRPRPPAGRGAEPLGKYVYCIIRATEPLTFGRIGLGAEPAEVYTINHEDLAAVVSDTPIMVYDPTHEHVLAHERVNEAVMRGHTVIPMSFGTVFRTREDVAELLRSAADAFRNVLEKMRGKFEFGLKVLWDRDAVLREIERDDEGLRRLRAEISSERGSTYFARVQYGRLAEAALQERAERYVAEILGALREVSIASRTSRPIGDKMILNAAFLVSREQEGAFDAAVKGVAARYDALTFRYTGPWPPYNFVNIRLKLERAKEAAS
ncbi:MAG TPA: GvpL/GvpF family gas vesicle protein [Thermodesulfobacteriota bacterium]|nr:GvpL/GvpF family gas vesicle protein [Thermodesulfobacteriota bacterium]